MEKPNFVRNSVVTLPPGFRFHPTDEELVVHYLKPKVFSCPLPVSIIPEVDVCKSDPWDLPGDSEQVRYFFSTKEAKYQNGNRSNRATDSGYWKDLSLDKQIVTSRNNYLVGMKKTLVFYRGKPPHGSPTDWIMHEYRLVGTGSSACTFPQNPSQGSSELYTSSLLYKSMMQMEDWVLCHIFVKKKSSKHEKISQPCNRNRVRMAQPSFIDFMMTDKNDSAPPSSCSGMSCITGVYSSVSDHEESSSCNSFY